MNFFKRLSAWSWFEIMFLTAIIFVDNLSVHHDGLWISLLISAFAAVSAIYDEMVYDFKLPVNHPNQQMDEREILASLIRSILSVALCFAAIRFSAPWIAVIAAGMMAVAAYATYKSYMLYLFTKDDVKYAD